MTDMEQALLALLVWTGAWAIFMTWLVVGMSRTIRDLRSRR